MHILLMTERADEKTGKLRRLIINIDGASSTNRAIFCEVLHSILLYRKPGAAGDEVQGMVG